MRLLVQRIREGWVDIAGDATPRVGPGLLALIGFRAADSEALLEPMATKLLQLRILSDEQGRMNRSLADTGGGLMLVSQFTLYADCSKGRRPSFLAAMPPVPAEALYDRFVAHCRSQGAALGIDVVTGRFGATMGVHLINEGPVTILLDSEELGFNPAPAASGA